MSKRFNFCVFCFVVMVAIGIGDVPDTVNLPRGQCTWYVHWRAQECGWKILFDKPYDRHAMYWWDKVTNAQQAEKPKKGAVMVLSAWDGNPYGHVAYVEKLLEDDKFLVTHANSALGIVVREIEGVKVYQSVCEKTDKGVLFFGYKKVFTVRGFLCPQDPS